MTDAVAIRRNIATASEIADHLRHCDDAFIPPLSTRVDIVEYAGKIARHATTFEAWADGQLVGLVAAYSNEEPARTAFVTNVSVIQDYRTLGLASRLLVQCSEFFDRSSYERLALEVDGSNQPALNLYVKAGFDVVGVDGPRVRMERSTRGDHFEDSEP